MLTRLILSALFSILSFSTLVFAKDNNICTYVDRGIKYYPHYVKRGTITYAKASWYGKPFHGRLTANGERYNMYKMTAAHRTYALGTILKVTSLKNWRSVIVRINDRGPFYSSRAIDLSYGAAKKLGFIKKGIEKIKMEVLSSKGIRKTSKKNKTIRNQKIQIASFFSQKNADLFKKEHNLKHVKIVKQYIKSHKKTAYKIIIYCTPWEANKLLSSKKFSNAYKI
jgi:rare lipoprotein A